MTTDNLTRARAVLAGLREAMATGGYGDYIGDLDNAAPALIGLAEAVGRLAEGDDWWYYRAADHDDGTPSCIGCGQLDWRPDSLNAGHDSDCPALAIDAALAELAALDGGEVG